MPRRPLLLVLLIAGCAQAPRRAEEPVVVAPTTPPHSQPPAAPPPPPPRPSVALAAPSEEVLDSGGELDAGVIPVQTVEHAAGRVVAWGITEVPANSRLQAAFALADAAARSELLAAVRVGIAALDVIEASTDAEQRVTSVTAQVAKGMLPGLAPARHGWQKVRRGKETVLRLVSRLEADDTVLHSVLRDALGGDELARRAAEAIRPGRAK